MQTSFDWFTFVTHIAQLSLFSFGGVLAVAPDIHRILVGQMGVLTDAQFTSSMAIGQAAPGPNVLFMAVLGYQAAGLLGALVGLAALLVPAATVTMIVAPWTHAHQKWIPLRAFRAGVVPIAIGLMASTSWVLASKDASWQTAAVTLATMVVVWRTRVHLLFLIAGGALLGGLGLL